jgi:hypothetical protein
MLANTPETNDIRKKIAYARPEEHIVKRHVSLSLGIHQDRERSFLTCSEEPVWNSSLSSFSIDSSLDSRGLYRFCKYNKFQNELAWTQVYKQIKASRTKQCQRDINTFRNLLFLFVL